MEKISVIVPCYNEQESLPYFYDEITKVASEIPNVEIEILFVDDGSKDNTLAIAKALNNKDRRIKYISFSRNFGKESAIFAGLQNVAGDYVVIMDADLQDPPVMLTEMYDSLIKEDYDCVATRRTTRKGEPPIRSFFARCFYRLINRVAQIEIVDGARDFRMMKRQVADTILQMTEYNRFSKGIFGWIGFKTKWLEYENQERVAGETKWSSWKLFKYSLEGIIAFSTIPLSISFVIGVIFCILSFLMIGVISIRQFLYGGSAYGWSSLVCIIFLISGLQFFCLSIVGQYLSKTYLETKRRPLYLIREANGEIIQRNMSRSSKLTLPLD
ncbi:MAG: glycosyltransferase family 2 protein [Desulfosporosinus sp.]